jgi:hypothetical protein
MIEDLVEVIDRSWQLLQKRTGANFVLACFPFVEQLKRDPRTASILDELRRENLQSREGIRAAREESRTQALAVFQELRTLRPDVFPTEPAPQGYDCTADTIFLNLQESSQESDAEVWAPFEGPGTYIGLDATLTILQSLLEKTDLENLKIRHDAVMRRLDFETRARNIYFRTAAGASLARIEREFDDLHPLVVEPGTSPQLEARRRMRDRATGTLYGALFGRRRLSVDNEISAEMLTKIDELRADMECLNEEIRRRLGIERSLLAVVDRYRQRCQWYDSEKLRALAKNAPGAPEDRLSETLATYLFDHGLNPLTRPLLGKVSPDIFHPHPIFSFYIEAKQYTQGCRKYLLQGMQQMWDMLSNVLGTDYDIREAFYVIYRRGGPRYHFPSCVPDKDRGVVHIIFIDIAAPNERGSNAPRTIAFKVEDLVPGAAVPDEEDVEEGEGE